MNSTSHSEQLLNDKSWLVLCVFLITIHNYLTGMIVCPINRIQIFHLCHLVTLNINDGWKNMGVGVSFNSRERVQIATRCPILIGMGKI